MTRKALATGSSEDNPNGCRNAPMLTFVGKTGEGQAKTVVVQGLATLSLSKFQGTISVGENG